MEFLIVLAFLAGVVSGLYFGVSRRKYDGQIVIQETETGKMYSLELDGDPEEMDGKRDVRFKIG